MTPGNRQTVAVVMLPGYGRGQLVSRNGPAFFVPENGEPVPVYDVSTGGWSKGGGSWCSVTVLADEPALKAQILEQGETHTPAYSSLFGEGWLVWSNWQTIRFEVGERVMIQFGARTVSVGRPDYLDKITEDEFPSYDDPDEPFWATYTTRDGDRLVFRFGGRPPSPGTVAPLKKHEYMALSDAAQQKYDDAEKISVNFQKQV